MIYLIIWCSFGIGGAIVASNRGGNGFVYFILGFIFGPIGFLLAFTEGVKCPYCQSKINKKALVCPRCQKEQPAKSAPVIPTEEEQRKMIEKSKVDLKNFGKYMAIGIPIVIIAGGLIFGIVYLFAPQELREQMIGKISVPYDNTFDGKTAIVMQNTNAVEFGTSKVIFSLKKDQPVIIERKLNDKCCVKKEKNYAWVDCNQLKY